MNQTVKLSVLASVIAAAALAAGCVPSLNYGSVPPEPKYTTKLTTTTATSATKKPFTTPKPRTGTISWEELNGPLEYATRVGSTTHVTSSYVGYIDNGGWQSQVISRDPENPDGNGEENVSSQTTAWEDDTPQTAATEAPQTEPPQTAPPEDVYVPPQEGQAPPAEPSPAPEPPPEDPAE